MEVIDSFPAPIPERVLVAGNPSESLTALLDRLALALDVPLVLAAELDGSDEWARLADFDGWVVTSDVDGARALLLERAQVVIHLAEEGGSIRKLVRRTVRRMRAEAPGPDLTWLDTLPLTHPDLAVVQLRGDAEVDDWFRSLETHQPG